MIKKLPLRSSIKHFWEGAEKKVNKKILFVNQTD